MKKDIAIIGGSIGGVMAALTAAKLGKKVVLTEETDWIGGQLTIQAVPPDEHRWIESFGCTKTYREFRNRIRDYYRQNYPLENDMDLLNPGNCWVSRIGHEPRAALQILYDLLQPYLSNGQITLLLEMKPISAEVSGDQIKSVTLKNQVTQQKMTLEAEYFLDATELGDLLPLTGAEYVIGAEAKADTGEKHALEHADPLDVQPITHVFALDYVEGEDHTIAKPEMYDFWRTYEPAFLEGHAILSEFMPDAEQGGVRYIPIFSKPDQLGLWEYRRIVDKTFFTEGFYEGDISLINWPQNDYVLGSIIDVPEDVRERRLEEAKQLSLSLLYWLQTEAPKEGGGQGYPGFRLRPDITGTTDGLAKAPYIRESRRIKAQYTVVEEDISCELRGEKGIKRLADSVGIGSYAMDLHPTTVNQRTFYAKSYPFEIPLGSFIPVRLSNLIPSCKNIGSTQLTNGSFRLHPVEWNIGEAAGALAAFALEHNKTPRNIYEDSELIKTYQDTLVELGVELHWPEDLEII